MGGDPFSTQPLHRWTKEVPPNGSQIHNSQHYPCYLKVVKAGRIKTGLRLGAVIAYKKSVTRLILP